MKRFYLAKYIDCDDCSATYGQTVVRTVTSNGWTKGGLRIDRWAIILAPNMAVARQQFELGNCTWFS